MKLTDIKVGMEVNWDGTNGDGIVLSKPRRVTVIKIAKEHDYLPVKIDGHKAYYWVHNDSLGQIKVCKKDFFVERAGGVWFAQQSHCGKRINWYARIFFNGKRVATIYDKNLFDAFKLPLCPEYVTE